MAAEFYKTYKYKNAKKDVNSYILAEYTGYMGTPPFTETWEWIKVSGSTNYDIVYMREDSVRFQFIREVVHAYLPDHVKPCREGCLLVNFWHETWPSKTYYTLVNPKETPDYESKIELVNYVNTVTKKPEDKRGMIQNYDGSWGWGLF